MQIYVFSKIPYINAEWHCDKHVCNNIREYTQILSTASRINGYDQGYKLWQPHNPLSKWVASDVKNWMWLRIIIKHLHFEYQKRYGLNKYHKSYKVCKEMILPFPKEDKSLRYWLIEHFKCFYNTKYLPEESKQLEIYNKHNILPNDFVKMVPDELKEYEVTEAYKLYFIQHKNHIAKWYKTNKVPEWYKIMTDKGENDDRKNKN